MKSITLHNLDDELYFRIRNIAKKNHRSMNQEIKDKLLKYFCPEDEKKLDNSFRQFLGVWSEKDYLDFTNNSSDFGKIVEGDWN